MGLISGSYVWQQWPMGPQHPNHCARTARAYTAASGLAPSESEARTGRRSLAGWMRAASHNRMERCGAAIALGSMAPGARRGARLDGARLDGARLDGARRGARLDGARRGARRRGARARLRHLLLRQWLRQWRPRLQKRTRPSASRPATATPATATPATAPPAAATNTTFITPTSSEERRYPSPTTLTSGALAITCAARHDWGGGRVMRRICARGSGTGLVVRARVWRG